MLAQAPRCLIAKRREHAAHVVGAAYFRRILCRRDTAFTESASGFDEVAETLYLFVFAHFQENRLALFLALVRVSDNGRDDDTPIGPVKFMPAAGDRKIFGAGHNFGNGHPMLDREDRVGGAMDYQQRRFERFELAFDSVAALKHEVVRGGE